VLGAIVAQPAVTLGGWLTLLGASFAAAAMDFPWEER